MAPVESIKLAKGNGSRSSVLHGHCYQKAQPPAADGYPMGEEASAELLRRAGWKVEVLETGCCGMAGAFGYESEHYELSMQVGEIALFPAIQNAGSAARIAAPGLSCRTQISSGTGREAKHPISLIAAELSADA